METPVDDTPPNDTSAPTSTDSTINGNGSTQPVGSSVDNTDEGGAVSTSTSGTSSLGTSNSLPNHVEEVPAVKKPKFFFVPVNRFGSSPTQASKLEDKGTNNATM